MLVLATLGAPAAARAVDGAGFAIEGQVYERGTRRPLPGATVFVSEFPDLIATSDTNGHYRLPLPNAGDYHLTAVLMGYEKLAPEAVTLGPGQAIAHQPVYLFPASLLPDVEVRADRTPDRVGKTVISGAELAKVPGSGGDPLNALQAMPGVVTNNDASSDPAIRGSGPQDNVYEVDFLPVGYLFHMGGFLSVFHNDLVQDFTLYSAAFGPEYFNAIGAALDVKLRDPRQDRFGAKLNISLLESDFLIEGPISPTQSYYVAARRSYIDLLLPRTGQLDEGVDYVQFPNYSDYQAKYLWRSGDRSSVTLSMSGARDRMELLIRDNAEAAQHEPALAGSLRTETRYDSQGIVWATGAGTASQNRVAVGRLRSEFDSQVGRIGSANVVLDSQFLREQLVWRAGSAHLLTLGGDVERLDVAYNLDFSAPNCSQFTADCDYTSAPRIQDRASFPVTTTALYLKDRWSLGRFTLIPGVRWGHEDYLNERYADPRLGAEWRVAPHTLLTAGWGKYHQFPEGIQAIDKFGNPHLGHQRGTHDLLGLEQQFQDGWTWKSEVYRKTFSHLVVDDPVSRYVNGGSGLAYGWDNLVKKDITTNWSGWLSLALSRSERTNELTGDTITYSYDQPLVATLVSTYKFTPDLSLGSKWRYHSGGPYTPVIGTRVVDGRVRPVYGAVNSERLPPYHRLDLRLDRVFRMPTWLLTTYVETINTYNRKNVADYSYSADYSSSDPVYQLPFLISFGVRAEF